MAHCPYEKLEDLKSALETIRSFPKLKEPKPGIFYLKSRGFLHFHIDKENQRWADVVDGKTWGKPITLLLKATKKQISDFVKEVEKRYLRTIGP